MKTNVIAWIIIVALLTSCSSSLNSNPSPELLETEIAKTQMVINQASTFVAATSAARPTSTLTLKPTLTPLATVTTTPTQVQGVEAISNLNANCRSGPGTVFPLIEVVPSGSAVSLTGSVLTDARWWKVTLKDGYECWLKENTVEVKGDVSTLPTLESPPTPTPIPFEMLVGAWNFSSPVIGKKTLPKGIQDQVTLSVNGLSLNFWCYTPDDRMLYFSGTLNPDRTLSGYVTYGGPERFPLHIRFSENNNQFVGSFYVDYANTNEDISICGAKVGTPLPSPCGMN